MTMNKQEFNAFIEEKLKIHGSYEYIAERIMSWEKTRRKNDPKREDEIYTYVLEQVLLNDLSIPKALLLAKEKFIDDDIIPNKKFFYKWLDKQPEMPRFQIAAYKIFEFSVQDYLSVIKSSMDNINQNDVKIFTSLKAFYNQLIEIIKKGETINIEDHLSREDFLKEPITALQILDDKIFKGTVGQMLITKSKYSADSTIANHHEHGQMMKEGFDRILPLINKERDDININELKKALFKLSENN